MQSDNWRQLADRYNTSIEDIKERLPLEWVVSVAAGVGLVKNGEGRSHGLCPFHPDTDPSFDVYGYGERWGCFPCGDGGDLFDFIGKYWELQSFSARIEKALDLLESFKAEDGKWTGVIEREGPLTPVTVAELSAEVQAAYDVMARETEKPIKDLLERKKITQIDLDWLKRTWRIGITSAGEVMAPYWDREGKLVTHKTRWPGRGGWYSRKGVSLTALYGEHQLQGAAAGADVWLCEGETDTWLASWLLRGRGVALGLPSGAGAHIRDEWVEMMRDRRVVIVFDADKAGRTAAERWWQSIHLVAREVVITFPESDLCESRDPERVLHSGRVVTSLPGFMTEDPDKRAYRTIAAQGPGEVLSNFVFLPTKVIEHRDTLGQVVGEGFEGSFADQAGVIRIRSTDFLTATSTREWATRHGRTWFGASAKHPQNLLAMLQARAPFLKKEIAVPVSGLWGVEEGHSVFVLPDASGGSIGSAIGRERWSHGEGARYDIGSRYRLVDREGLGTDWAVEALRQLLMLNHARVTTPMLAWMVAAPLRSLVREFPPLAVLGESDSGKTTMTLLVMKLLWGWQGAEQNLTNTTPYAIKQASAASNGLPMWWDEYRRGARRDAFEAMGQVLRDSWTGSVSSRGGVGDDLSRIEVTASMAPLVLSGEAGMEERSHQDRVVVVNLGFEGKSIDAMERVSGMVEAGGGGVLGRRLIEWQLEKLDEGDPLVALGAPAKPDRQEQGVAVLQWGWAMLVAFLHEVMGIEIAWELDLSLVHAERSGRDEFPELTALGEALQQGVRERSDSFAPVAWIEDREGDVVAVQQRAFYKWATRAGYELPGGERSTMELLKKRFGVLNDRAVFVTLIETKQVRAWRLVGLLSYLSSKGVEISDRAPWDGAR